MSMLLLCKFSQQFKWCVRKAKAQDQYSTYMAKDDLEKLLVEATANENWNISNSKMLQISDATYEM